MNRQLMQSLADRSGLAKKYGVHYVDASWPYLSVEHPAGAARVVGEAQKDEAQRKAYGRVFLRGQSKHYNEMRPSLFRGQTEVEIPDLLKAEKEFVKQIKERLPQARFRRPDLPALLQHYGYRTSWLDVVDNLFVAAWFASHKIGKDGDSGVEVLPSQATHGWLYLLATGASYGPLHVVDLRREHHPLSARPHVQHGVSVTPQDACMDIREIVIATMRVPLVSFGVSGALFEPIVMLPPKSEDHTLRILLEYNVDDIAREVETAIGVRHGALGRVSYLRSH
jgi:hypothetical protein